jgi:hypothetical protein
LGIAFGLSPGADPTPGVIDGHGAWASDLRIAPLVAQCVHFVATHEMRNSFPLDSAREGRQYPPGVDERAYPGVHSNVGGGYRPGEGGKSQGADESLSLAPLRAMHDAALAAGVPLSAKTDPRSGSDFVMSVMLAKRFNAVLRAVHSGSTKHLEAHVLGQMRLYYAWRFKRIRERGQGPRIDAGSINAEEARYRAERAQLDQEIAAAERDPVRLKAQQRVALAEREEEAARSEQAQLSSRDWPDDQALTAAIGRSGRAEADLADARAQFARADDARMKLLARRATLGDNGLVNRLETYDRHLLLDVQAILNVRKAYPRARLRPHYANVLEAYEAEFVRGRGLLDEQPDALAFFDHYVHDSLAGFAKDATLPSDPRVIYIGGDRESRYADPSTPAVRSASVA